MFNNPLGSSAADRIDRFLNDHPDGALFVAVGDASVAGLAWLGKRSVGRPVTLIIGNAQASRFQRATEADRGAAVEFLLIFRLVFEVLDAAVSESPQQSRPGSSRSRNRSRHDDTDVWDDSSDDSDGWDDSSDSSGRSRRRGSSRRSRSRSDEWDESSDDSDEWDDFSDDSDGWDDSSDSSRRRGGSRRSRSRSDDWDDSFDW